MDLVLVMQVPPVIHGLVFAKQKIMSNPYSCMEYILILTSAIALSLRSLVSRFLDFGSMMVTSDDDLRRLPFLFADLLPSSICFLLIA